MSCQRCKSERVMHVSCKCSDMFNASMGEKDTVFGEGGWGDYVRFNLCLSCGQMQGTWPNPETAFERGEEE